MTRVGARDDAEAADGSADGVGRGDTADARFRELVAALTRLPFVPEDDGSLTARLFHQPGLADALLGRAPLDPDGTPDLSRASESVAAILDVGGPVGPRELDETLDASATRPPR